MVEISCASNFENSLLTSFRASIGLCVLYLTFITLNWSFFLVCLNSPVLELSMVLAFLLFLPTRRCLWILSIWLIQYWTSYWISMSTNLIISSIVDCLWSLNFRSICSTRFLLSSELAAARFFKMQLLWNYWIEFRQLIPFCLSFEAT